MGVAGRCYRLPVTGYGIKMRCSKGKLPVTGYEEKIKMVRGDIDS